jgi:hypothetical protein
LQSHQLFIPAENRIHSLGEVRELVKGYLFHQLLG